MEVHVVSKQDNQKHAVATLNHLDDNQDLTTSTSTVRVQPTLISLSSNNLSYARGGDLLHWWDAYPVPETLPTPYNDSKSWGMVPAWGFGVVTDSSPDIELQKGTLFWGFWPTANIPVTLHLLPSNVNRRGHWTETSEERKRLMTVYNDYSEEEHIDLPESDSVPANSITSLINKETLNRLSWTALFRPTWETGYLLSRHTFTSAPNSPSQPPIHPLGTSPNLPWTADDADISNAALISLSASSKTARSFAYHVFRRDKNEGPTGFLQISSAPDVLGHVPGVLGTAVPAKALRYDQVDEAVEWIGALKPGRIVIVDFGARAGTLERLVERIQAQGSALKEVKITIVNVGSEQKVYSAEDIKESRAAMQALNKIQCNTSGLRDAAIELTSADEYDVHMKPVWEDWMRVSHEIMPDIEVKLGKGVSGEGIEGGWRRLCAGGVGAGEGLVYTL